LIEKLEWDSNFFGEKIGRLTNISSEAKLKKILRSARASNYSYLSYRAPLNISVVNKLESDGFYIADIGVVFERDLKLIPKTKIPVRKAEVKDRPLLKKLTKGLFVYSRFYNDPFFSSKDADRLYGKWIESSFNKKTAKIFMSGNCGFVLCEKLPSKKGKISLIGVSPKKQYRGMGQALLAAALKWFRKSGSNKISVRTQINNFKAFNLYVKTGFKIKYIDITMGIILKRN
jgi:ribosomal protein S18 acetylase RimI-like enzyme